MWIGTGYTYRQQFRFVIYALGALSFITMCIVLWRAQHPNNEDEKESVFDRRPPKDA